MKKKIFNVIIIGLLISLLLPASGGNDVDLGLIDNEVVQELEIRGTGELSFNTAWKKYESYDTPVNEDIGFVVTPIGQTFTVGNTGPDENFTIRQIRVKIHRDPNATDVTETFSIRATDASGIPTGSDLSTGTFNVLDIVSINEFPDGKWYKIHMTPYTLNSSTKYALLFTNSNQVIAWARDALDSTYTGGNALAYTGVAWIPLSLDYLFEIWGSQIPLIRKGRMIL